MGPLQAIRYRRGSLELLNQRLLPLESVFLPVDGTQQAWAAIKDMVVRGAPAIGVTAALALAVELHCGGGGGQFGSTSEAIAHVGSRLDYLVTRWGGFAPPRTPSWEEPANGRPIPIDRSRWPWREAVMFGGSDT